MTREVSTTALADRQTTSISSKAQEECRTRLENLLRHGSATLPSGALATASQQGPHGLFSGPLQGLALAVELW